MKMSDDLLQADEALHALIQELERFKSASERLTLADDRIGALLQSVEQLVGLSADLSTRSADQLKAMRDLSADIETRSARSWAAAVAGYHRTDRPRQ